MRYCLLFLLAISVFAACKKTEVAKTKQDTLRENKWWVDTITVAYHLPYHDTDSVYGIGDAAFKIECRMDDNIVFRDGSEGAHITSEKKCGAELEEYRFTWGLTENDTKMYIYGASSFLKHDNINATVKELAGDKFTIVYEYYRDLQTTGKVMIRDTAEYTVTFVKK